MVFSITTECILAYLPYIRNLGFDIGFIAKANSTIIGCFIIKLGNKSALYRT